MWAGAQPRDEDALDPDFVRRLEAVLTLCEVRGQARRRRVCGCACGASSAARATCGFVVWVFARGVGAGEDTLRQCGGGEGRAAGVARRRPSWQAQSVARPRDQLAFSLLSITLISLKECGLTGSPSVCSCTHFRVYAMVP